MNVGFDAAVLPSDQLAALIVAVSFAAGLNVSATIATLGLLARLGEDAFAIFISWFAARHPFLAATIVGLLLVVIVLLLRWVVRGLRALFRAKPELARSGAPQRSEA